MKTGSVDTLSAGFPTELRPSRKQLMIILNVLTLKPKMVPPRG